MAEGLQDDPGLLPILGAYLPILRVPLAVIALAWIPADPSITTSPACHLSGGHTRITHDSGQILRLLIARIQAA